MPHEPFTKRHLPRFCKLFPVFCLAVFTDRFSIIVYMPMTALFILFDFIIHNPAHVDAGSSLVLLESVTGYFSALEYATGGYLPGSMLIRFASIAREFHSSPPAAHANDIRSAGSDMDTAVERSVSETYGASSFTHSQSPSKVRFASDPMEIYRIF